MNEVEQILKDLYASDPDLQAHEPKLKVIIARLLETKPNAHLDPHFASLLRTQLMNQAEQMQNSNNEGFWNKYRFAFGGVLAVLVLAVGAYFANQYRDDNAQLAFGDTRIDRVGENAFGTLADPQATQVAMGMGAGGSEMSSPVPPTTDTATMNNPVSSKMMAPGSGGGSDIGIYRPINVKYKYVGDEITEIPSNVDVYKRIRDPFTSLNTNTILRQLSRGLINTNAFANTQLDYLTISEDRDFGFTINFSAPEGSIYMNSNWRKWPNPTENCTNDECYRAAQMKESDMPADDAVLAVANDFLKERGIKTTNYGKPQVQNQWRREYAVAVDKTSIYIPDTVSVVYPNVIEGSEVFDESGMASGLMVSVNVRYMKVSGAGEIINNHYQASAYQAETNIERLVSVAENGGFRNYYGNFGDGVETITEELGTPTLSFVKIYQYQGNTATELFVPAYVFPILTDNAKQPYFRASNVIVPIVAQFLNEQPMPPVGIMAKPASAPAMDMIMRDGIEE